MPRLVLGRAIDRRDFRAGHAEVDRELSAVVDLIVQQEPEHVEAPQVAHFLGSRHELDRRIELRVVHLLHLVADRFQGLLHLADHALPGGGHRRHVRRGRLHLALDGLRAPDAFEDEGPGEVFRAAAAGVWLQVGFVLGIGFQQFQRECRFVVPRLLEFLLLAHDLSSLNRACNLPHRRALASRGTSVILYQYTGTRGRRVFHGIDPRSPIPLYVQIAERVRLAIATGTLGSAASLPSVRQLAAELRINPATVIQAYRDLEAQGFVEIRHGAGTFVRELAPGRRARERSQQAVALVRKLLADARRSGVSLAELQRALETELGAKTT